jgi:hypothetical protein
MVTLLMLSARYWRADMTAFRNITIDPISGNVPVEGYPLL